MAAPVSPEQYGAGKTDAELIAAGWVTGLKVWDSVIAAYVDYMGGDAAVANSQLWSLREAIRAELLDELADKESSGSSAPDSSE